ncbi:KRR1 family protein [Tasmannia lanceolata]|uniref:KRR1 family protein n=1 Tax=Tasmannia lanceolata TaxID=3420 RepID=UPI004064869F
MGRNLFEGTGSDEDEDISKIEINKEFARRFEHNKKREDLQRLEDLKKKGLAQDSEGSSSESDDFGNDFLDSDTKDLQFYDVLVRVKKKDPIINQDTKLFDSDNEEEEDEDEDGDKTKAAKDKPMYLKDVVAKQLIEEGPEFENESKSRLKSYADEQEELRQAFLNAAGEAFKGDEGDLLMEKKRVKGDEEEEENVEIQKRLDEYFGEDGNLSESEMFLKSFLQNKMWVDKEQKPFREDLYGIDEDEDELEKQDKYETEYNYRYEEGAGDRVLGHARFIDGSIRKKTNARKVQRKSKEERMAQAEFERKEELKHLKNVKKKEIMEKLEKIRAIAGIGEGRACALNEDDLDEDFDPEEYDRKMKETFDEDYYGAKDADPGFQSDGDDGDLEKPDFDKEDELLGLPKDWNVHASGDGFLAAREKILKRKGESLDGELLNNRAEEERDEGGKRKRKRKISLREKLALDQELEEYYKLDYEDTIGDLKTRFKYTSVQPNRYGLNAVELLMTDDKDLSQYVSLKKLAPYRQNEWKVPNLTRYHQKMKSKLLLQGGKSNGQKVFKKHRSKHDGQATSSIPVFTDKEKSELGESNDDVSRRSRKRRRQAELKLSQSRLMAYGKIPPKSKIQKNH